MKKKKRKKKKKKRNKELSGLDLDKIKEKELYKKILEKNPPVDTTLKEIIKDIKITNINIDLNKQFLLDINDSEKLNYKITKKIEEKLDGKIVKIDESSKNLLQKAFSRYYIYSELPSISTSYFTK